MDDATFNLNVDMKRWRTRVLDRREWTSVMREAKAKLTDL
jgi:alpha-L-fucosidase